MPNGSSQHAAKTAAAGKRALARSHLAYEAPVPSRVVVHLVRLAALPFPRACLRGGSATEAWASSSLAAA
jgi:hypothetical protein